MATLLGTYWQYKFIEFDGFSSTVETSFTQGTDSLAGCNWDGTDLHSCLRTTTDKLRKHTNFTSTIQDSFNSPSTNPTGISNDTTPNTYSCDSDAGRHYKHSGFTSTVTDSFSISAARGADWIIPDADYACAVGGAAKYVTWKVGFSSTNEASFYADDLVTGIAIDESGNCILAQDAATDHIQLHSGFTSTVSDSFNRDLDGVVWTGRQYAAIGEDVLSSDINWDKIFHHVGFSATLHDSWAASTGIAGIDWDGNDLYSADRGTDKHYFHSGFTATVQDSYSTGYSGGYSSGYTWDGTNSIGTSTLTTDKHYKHSGFSSTITDSYNSPSSDPTAVVWDGTNLLSTDNVTNKHYKHSGFSSTITDSYVGPDGTAISWDGSNVLSSENAPDKEYLHSGFSSTISDSYAFGSGVLGMSWGGRGVTYTQYVESNETGPGTADCAKLMRESGATTGTCQFTVIKQSSEDVILICTPSNVPGTTSWAAGNYKIKIEISTGETDLRFTEIYVERVQSNGTTVQATVGSLTGLTETCTAGVHNFTVSGSAQSAATTERLRVRVKVENTAHGDRSATWDQGDTTDNTVRTPWAVGAPAATLDQEGYRWRNDDGSESAATWKVGQDLDISNISKYDNFRLRALVDADGDPGANQYQCEWRKVGDASWTTLGAS
jgi:hypothetical protein